MSTAFFPAPDNVTTTTPGYAAAAGSIALASGTGALFGSAFPLLVSTFLADGTAKGVYSCSGRSVDTLTGLTLVSGTDATLPSGSTVAVRWTAEHVAQYSAAVNALEALEATTVYTTGTYANPAWITSLAGSKVTGNIAGSAAGLTANIAESQVTGLTSDLAARLAAASNLSDLASTATARTNLGLGSAALLASSAVVQSISLTTPSVLYTSPVTWVVAAGAATATLALLTQTANTVLAGPTSGAAASPTFRALAAADVPAHAHSAADVTSGTLAVARGGTGLSTVASGKLLYASALDTLAPLALGTNLSVTSGTLNASSGAPAGSDTQVQYNNAGAFGASSKFVYDGSTLALRTNGAANIQDWRNTGGTLLAYADNGAQFSMPRLGLGAAPTGGNRLNVAQTTAGTGALINCTAASGSNYGFDSEATGSGATLNCGGYFYAVGGTTNYGVQVAGPGAGANNYAIYSSAAAKSYFAGGLGVGTTTPAAQTHTVAGSAATVALAVQGAPSQSAPLSALAGVSSTSAARDLGYLDAGFTVPTDASYKGFVRLCAQDFNAVSGGREGVRVGTTGTAPTLGFYGVTPVARAAAPVTLSDVIALLQALGLCS
jgi:hypothetical protein